MLKNFKKKNNNKGFTLVELLVVIAIMGILAVVAVPSLFKNLDKARAAEATSYINAYKTAALSEYANGNYTVDETKIAAAVEGKQPECITGVTTTISADGISLSVTVTAGNVADLLEAQFDGTKDDSSVTIN